MTRSTMIGGATLAISGGGGGGGDVTFGTTAGTAAEGNDSRIVGAAQLSGATFTGTVVAPHLTVNPTVSPLATLGPELLTNGTFATDASGWTLGTGWTWQAGTDGEVAHAAGNTATLTTTLSVTAGQVYLFTWTGTRSASSISVTVGSVTILTNQGISTLSFPNAYGFTAADTGTVTLTITPNTAFVGTFSVLSVRPVSAGTAQLVLNDETGSVAGEARGSAAITSTAYGKGALSQNAAATNCVAFGGNALNRLVSGTKNTAIGYGAVALAVSAQAATAVGTSALAALTAGYSNTAVGSNSLTALTTGRDNTGIGTASGPALTDGICNTTLGSASLLNAGAGSNQNVAVGYNAGVCASSSTNISNNTIVGALAGVSLATNATGNVFLGQGAGYSETGSNKLYISNSTTTTPMIGGDFSTNAVTMAGTLALGTNPASTGVIRIPNNSYIYGRNAANDGDRHLISVNSSNAVQMGDASGATLIVGSSASVTGASLAIGTNPASTGIIRLPHGSVIAARNSTNTLDQNLLGFDSGVTYVYGTSAVALMNGATTRVSIGTNFTFSDAYNIVLGTTTGTQIGTAASQKLGYWGATPAVQPPGWGTPSGTLDRTAFDPATVTTLGIAQRLAALITDLKAIGLVGA